MTTYQPKPDINLNWQKVKKPAEITEARLIKAILEGFFPVNSYLPGERELADALGVTRPTLRETLQRLERDGWVEIHHGKPTRVRDYWNEGSLGVLNALACHPKFLPDNFIPDLLTVRLAMAPTYTAMAVEKAPEEIIHLLERSHHLADDPQSFAHFDWRVHHILTRLSENPVFVMILNGFQDLYLHLAPFYFAIPAARQHSINYYQDLSHAAFRNDQNQAKTLTEKVMRESMSFWLQVNIT
jgi:GntR family transcriptional regulator, negative regulator for fad regulon and positive regulator of fabA